MNFNNFFSDMGVRPDGMTLDRKDSNLGYSKENCRWATKETQQNNMRNNRMVEIKGAIKSVAQWARHFGVVSQQVANLRLKRGVEPLIAFTKPRNRTWRVV
jgi:hypothetical protein